MGNISVKKNPATFLPQSALHLKCFKMAIHEIFSLCFFFLFSQDITSPVMARDVTRTDTTISQVVLMTSSMSKAYGLVQLKLRMLWYGYIRDFFFFINPSILVILLLRSITLSNSVNEFFPWSFPIFCNETLWKSTFSPQNYFIHSWQDNHDAVAETAVVGYPHEIKGQGLWTIIIYYVYIDTERDDFFVA